MARQNFVGRGDTAMTTQVRTFGNDYLIGVDGETNIIWGDTDGIMSHSTGGNDILIAGAHSPLNEVYGDALH
jgi:hypothetical protein